MTRREYMRAYKAKNRAALLEYRRTWKRNQKLFILCAKSSGDQTKRNNP